MVRFSGLATGFRERRAAENRRPLPRSFRLPGVHQTSTQESRPSPKIQVILGVYESSRSLEGMDLQPLRYAATSHPA